MGKKNPVISLHLFVLIYQFYFCSYSKHVHITLHTVNSPFPYYYIQIFHVVPTFVLLFLNCIVICLVSLFAWPLVNSHHGCEV
jgi:type III secretory pathway component EscU